MKYLVTGGAGFIGSHITRALLKQNADVRVLDNFSSGNRENLKGLDVEIIEGDLRDTSCVTEAVRDVNIIFHEAAFVSVPESMEKPQECFDVNVTGTSVLLEVARKAGVRRVDVASSAAVYGDSTAMPLVEDTLLKQLSPYATSKRINEMYAELFTNHFGLEVVALRYFNVYGPRQRPDSMYAAAVPISSAVCWITNPSPFTVTADKPVTWSTYATWCKLICSLHVTLPRPGKSSTFARESKPVCLTCLIFSTRSSPTPPNMSMLNPAQATSIARLVHRARQ
jgi:nucleoside-diphosphate-sugar epimerase